MLGLAFIIPAYKTFEDIKSRFGEEPLLCSTPSVVQPYDALNDDKHAEQPLLDLVIGKGTGPMIQPRGFPRVDKTVTVEVIAAYDHRAPYSIVYSDLGDDATKIEKTLKMILRNGPERLCILLILKANMYFLRGLDAADWGPVRSVVQNILNELTAFCGNNILRTWRPTTGASNQLMAATFKATTSSAIPPYFGSIIPRIDAYAYIGRNPEMSNVAAPMVRN